MRTMSIALAILAACAGRVQATPPERSVTYFEGTSVTSSPDGATAYGPPTAVLVRRTVDPTARTIEEYVVHPGEAFPTTMRQLDGAVFSARDAAGSFSGSLTYEGPAWAFTGWDYDLAMTDGSGKIVGHGAATAGAITTDKRFVDPSGTLRARIREDLRAIDEARYRARVAELLPAAQ